MEKLIGYTAEYFAAGEWHQVNAGRSWKTSRGAEGAVKAFLKTASEQGFAPETRVSQIVKRGSAAFVEAAA